jgi:hypothetical protein
MKHILFKVLASFFFLWNGKCLEVFFPSGTVTKADKKNIGSFSSFLQKWVSKNPLKLAIELSLKEARQREGGLTSDGQKNECSSEPSTKSPLLCGKPSDDQSADSKVEDEGKQPAINVGKPVSGRKEAKPAGAAGRVDEAVVGGPSGVVNSTPTVTSQAGPVDSGSELLTSASQSEEGTTARRSGRIPNWIRLAGLPN